MLDQDNQKSSYKFKILHEVVAEEDLFEDKPHEKVSNLLFELIDTNEKGITIGLDGSWGSGKSTVINLLRDRLSTNQDKKTLFFIFDAWAHDGDPLRRIFLESLISEIDPEDKNPKLIDIKSRVSCRKKTLKIKSEKSTSTLVKYLSFSALLLPVGSSIMTKIDVRCLNLYTVFFGLLFLFGLSPITKFCDYLKLNFKKLLCIVITLFLLFCYLQGLSSLQNSFSLITSKDILAILASVFLLAPLIVSGYWYCWGDKDGDGKVKWEIFESKSTEDYTQDITDDGERTSVEFENFFIEIVKNIMGDNGQYKRLVIVIDNMDRVSPEHAKAIWSTLQTFFHHRGNKNLDKHWQDSLWFIVPFDRGSFRRIWNQDSEVKNKHEDNPKPSQDKITTESFFEKCFQIIAEVPEPVMSTWIEYANLAIERSLIEWNDKQKKIVLDTYKKYLSCLDISPTPRQIHVIINQIGMLGMRWGDEMSPEAMCLYAIYRQKYSEHELRKLLLEQSILNDFHTVLDPEEIKMQLSGMLFGVPKEKGFQLLLEPAIRLAFKNGDDTLGKLAETHKEGFWVVWRVSDFSLTHRREHLDLVIQAIYGLEEFKENIQYDIEYFIDLLIDSMISMPVKKLDYTKLFERLLGLLINPDANRLIKEQSINSIEGTVANIIERLISTIDTKDFDKVQLSKLNILFDFLKSNDQPYKIIEYAKLSVINWGIWVDAQNDMEVIIREVLPARGTVTELANSFITSDLEIKFLNLLLFTAKIDPESEEWVGKCQVSCHCF